MNEAIPESTESEHHKWIAVAIARQGRRVEYVSIAWTSLEAISGIISGLIAGRMALIGFGADSVIEIASSAILLWRGSGHEPGGSREDAALNLEGGGFLVLAFYVAFESVESLLRHEAPRVSYFGIG